MRDEIILCTPMKENESHQVAHTAGHGLGIVGRQEIMGLLSQLDMEHILLAGRRRQRPRRVRNIFALRV